MIGLNAKTYRNTGSYESPTWVEFKNIVDLEYPDSMQEADFTTRGSNGFSEKEPTLRDLELNFGMVNKAGDADLAAVATAYASRAKLDLQVLDNGIAVNGAKGVRARWKVFSFKKGQPLAGAQTMDVGMKPCVDAHPPSDVTISS